MSSSVDRKAFRDLSYGLYIVTSRDQGRFNGQVVNTVIQVTSDPPRIAVIINRQNLTHSFIASSRVFGVSVLEQDAPLPYFGPFGFRSGREIDKLAKVPYKAGAATGCPLLTEHVLSVMEARVADSIDLGSHTIFVGDVLGSEVLKSGRPLLYHYYHENLKGRSPKNAPTFEPQA
jgi:flavin reductase (DIM6/NTAB) family NADH-FMN oxidoreductase RutF